MVELSTKASEAEKEQNEQVWKAFTHILEQVETIFGDESLLVDDFLSILRSGMLACDYRTVPVTVDVVNVKKYDLIQPHSAPYVFALGMTQSHFPKVGQNKSLLSDEAVLLPLSECRFSDLSRCKYQGMLIHVQHSWLHHSVS